VADDDAAIDEGGEFSEGLCSVDAFFFDTIAGDSVDFGGFFETSPAGGFGGPKDSIEFFFAFERGKFYNFIFIDVEASCFSVDNDGWVCEERAEGIAVGMCRRKEQVAQTEADLFGQGADLL